MNRANTSVYRWHFLCLLAIMLAGLLLRYQSAWFSYPLITHPDEPVVMNIVQRMLMRGDPNPHFFNYPSLLFYLQAGLAWNLGHLHHAWTGVGLSGIAKVDLLVAGRLFASLAASLSLLAIFLAGRRMLHPVVGLMAALMVALSPLHVHNSALVTTDIWVAIFAAWICLQCVCLLQEQRWRDYLLAGILVGLAAGAKYTAIFFSLGILLAHMMAKPPSLARLWDRKLMASAAACVLTFLTTTPYALLDSSSFLKDVVYESRHYRRGHPGAEAEGNSSWHLYAETLFSTTGLGMVAALLLTVGLVWAVRKRHAATLVVAVLPLVLFAFVGNYKVFFERNIVGALPGLALITAVGLYLIYQWLVSLSRQRVIATLVTASIFSAVVVPAAAESFRQTASKRLTDTRLILIDWIKQHIPAGSSIAVGGLSTSLDSDFPDLKFPDARKVRTNARNELRFVPEVDFVIIGSRSYGRFFEQDGQPKPMYKVRAERYLDFFANHHLVHEIGPQQSLSSGPTIKVFANRPPDSVQGAVKP